MNSAHIRTFELHPIVEPRIPLRLFLFEQVSAENPTWRQLNMKSKIVFDVVPSSILTATVAVIAKPTVACVRRPTKDHIVVST